jgi:hypothetical protein
MFYDFYGDKTSKRMEFIVDNKIVKTLPVENPARNSFYFYKNELSELISKYSNKYSKFTRVIQINDSIR